MTKRNQKYPWNVWMDGSIHTITQGVDFDCGVTQMRNYLYQRATNKDVNVRVYLKRRVDGSQQLEFQFLGVSRLPREDVDQVMREMAALRLAEPEEPVEE